MRIKCLYIYIIVVCLGVVIIDMLCRFTFTPFFDNPPIQTKAGATYKFVSCKEPANIIILGASRANHHYRCYQMEDSLGVSVFNYGWDGRCTLYQYLCLLRGIANGGLGTAILDISDAQLSKQWVDERISDLYPYYWKNDTVRMMIEEVEKKDMRFLMMSSMVQYNSQYLNMIVPIQSFKGYTPLQYKGKAVEKKNKISLQKSDFYYSDIALKYFKRIAMICNKNNINFIVCLSPSLSVSQKSRNYILSLCSDYGIVCWDKTDFIKDGLLFSDDDHLNDKGAERYTREIINMLKQNNYINRK